MASKLEAARLASAEGTAVLIAGGARDARLERALAGEDVGTLITGGSQPPGAHRATSRSARGSRGALVVNDGALQALVCEEGVAAADRRGRASRGRSSKGDVVEIRDGSGRVHGRGLVNYAGRCLPQAGRPSQRGDRHHPRLARLRCRSITRDNLVMGAV